MKNKVLKLTAFIFAFVSLAGCQKDADVLGISERLANQTMLGYYTYTNLDSTTMNVTKQEFFLNRDENGVQNGYYRVSKVGQSSSTDVSTPITWEAKMADDQLSMIITALLKDGTQKTVSWADGIIKEEGKNYTKSAGGLSMIEIQNSVLSEIYNTEYLYTDTSFYSHPKVTKYLAWNFKIWGSAKAADTLRIKDSLTNVILSASKDTIIWFMKYKAENHRVSEAYLDTVTNELHNIVVVSKESTDAGDFGIKWLKSSEASQTENINDRPSQIIYTNIKLNEAGGVKTASYKYQKSYYSQQHYTKPGTAKDVVIDTTYTFEASKWAMAAVTNLAIFDIVLFGNGDSTFVHAESGATPEPKHVSQKDVYFVMPISNYGKKKSFDGSEFVQLKYNDITYRKQ